MPGVQRRGQESNGEDPTLAPLRRAPASHSPALGLSGVKISAISREGINSLSMVKGTQGLGGGQTALKGGYALLRLVSPPGPKEDRRLGVGNHSPKPTGGGGSWFHHRSLGNSGRGTFPFWASVSLYIRWQNVPVYNRKEGDKYSANTRHQIPTGPHVFLDSGGWIVLE